MSHASGPAAPRAFPLLRGAADLLMMPKELLLDEAVRNDVYQAMTIRCVVLCALKVLLQEVMLLDGSVWKGVCQALAVRCVFSGRWG
eukprot:1153750-Pelagomonas_calceolata.AAC.7